MNAMKEAVNSKIPVMDSFQIKSGSQAIIELPDHMDQEVLDNLTAPIPKSVKVFQVNDTIQELMKPTGGDCPEPDHDDEDDKDHL